MVSVKLGYAHMWLNWKEAEVGMREPVLVVLLILIFCDVLLFVLPFNILSKQYAIHHRCLCVFLRRVFFKELLRKTFLGT